MSASLTLVVLMAVMYGTGVYVMLEKSLTRILIGFLLVGNATNLLIFLMSGRAGSSPIIDGSGVAAEDMVDPVPQVLMLTAIVINFGVTAFILALIYRSWWLSNLGDEGDDVLAAEAEEEAIEQDAAEIFHASLDDDDEAVRHVLEEGEEPHEGDEDPDAPPATEEPSEQERDVMR